MCMSGVGVWLLVVGGALVREAFTSLVHDIFSSNDLDKTFRHDLPAQPPQPFVMEFKPSVPLHDRLADYLGVGKRDSDKDYYQVAVSTVLAKVKDLDLAVKGRGIRELTTALASLVGTKPTPQDHNHPHDNENHPACCTKFEDQMIDLRKLVSRLPVKICNALEATLITNQVMRLSCFPEGGGLRSNLSC